MAYLSATEMATKLGLNVKQVRKVAGAGAFKGAHKLGRMWFIPEDAVYQRRQHGVNWPAIHLQYGVSLTVVAPADYGACGRPAAERTDVAACVTCARCRTTSEYKRRLADA